MTKEEAKQWLKSMKSAYALPIEAYEALDLAIESLSADTVPKGLLEQFRWERDVAMMQLEEYGIPFLTNKDEDIVKVVRCKDCKNNYNTCTNHGTNQPMCDFTDRMLKETDFCSRGERREP